jgi:hypothetical protein
MKFLSVGVFLLLMVASLAGTARILAQSAHAADGRQLQRLETVWNEAHERGDASVRPATAGTLLKKGAVTILQGVAPSSDSALKLAAAGRKRCSIASARVGRMASTRSEASSSTA